MLRNDIAATLASKLGLTKKAADQAVQMVFDQITKALKSGDSVMLTRFGRFSVKVRKARKGVNPQNPTQKINIPSSRVPSFKAGKDLKAAVAK